MRTQRPECFSVRVLGIQKRVYRDWGPTAKLSMLQEFIAVDFEFRICPAAQLE
jgi:hypothetical protein